jgi:hypothetical protein
MVSLVVVSPQRTAAGRTRHAVRLWRNAPVPKRKRLAPAESVGRKQPRRQRADVRNPYSKKEPFRRSTKHTIAGFDGKLPRRVYRTEDGELQTSLSKTVSMDGGFYNLPSLNTETGKEMGMDEMIAEATKRGELGKKFKTKKAAERDARMKSAMKGYLMRKFGIGRV